MDTSVLSKKTNNEIYDERLKTIQSWIQYTFETPPFGAAPLLRPSATIPPD